MLIVPCFKCHFSASVIAIVCLLGGCATAVRPSELKSPEVVTCIEVSREIVAHEIKGLLKFEWTTKIASGPYISEREDAEGTYYRAPSGGIYIGRDDLADKPPIPLLPRNFDGGIWIPRAASGIPHLYTYISTQEATIVPLPENASCRTAAVVHDPQSSGVSSVAFATGGAIGGATGAVVARSAINNSSMSYGQSASAGAVGGAIGGLIVAGLINMDIGKIVHRSPSTDLIFVSNLQALAKAIVTIPVTYRESSEKSND